MRGYHEESIGESIYGPSDFSGFGLELALSEALTTGTVAWPSANLALYYPIRVLAPVLLTSFQTFNGTSVSGNRDVGLYDAQGNRLISSGSTAGAGTSAFQTYDVADTLIPRGLYFLALATDNTTNTFGRVTPAAAALAGWGMRQQATAFPLPSTATFALPTTTFCINTAGLSFHCSHSAV